MVETGGLENRLALTGYGGSNPSPQYIHFIINEMESLLALRNPNVLFVTVCWGRMLLAESLEVIQQTASVILIALEPPIAEEVTNEEPEEVAA